MNGKKNTKTAVKSFEGDFWNSHHGFIIFPTLNGPTVGTAVVGVGDWWDRARLQECAFLATDCPVQQEHSNHSKDSFFALFFQSSCEFPFLVRSYRITFLQIPLLSCFWWLLNLKLAVISIYCARLLQRCLEEHETHATGKNSVF